MLTCSLIWCILLCRRGGKNETKRNKLLDFVEEAQEILKGMPEGEWEKEQIWSHSNGSDPHNAT